RLIDQIQRAGGVCAELELGVGNDDASRCRIGSRLVIELDRFVTHLCCHRAAEQLLRLPERNVLVMRARGRLGGWGEDRLRQLFRFSESRGKSNATDRAALAVLLPTRA